ncbi:TPA: hypothetical protein ACH3X1_013967 [Trebouxia sp. C0004]
MLWPAPKDPADLFEDLANIEIVAMWNEAFFELHYKPTALHQRGSVGSAAEFHTAKE